MSVFLQVSNLNLKVFETLKFRNYLYGKFFCVYATNISCKIYVFTVICTDSGPSEPFAPLNRDMAFVVELTQMSALAVRDLQDYIDRIIRDMNLHHPQWIANYYVAAYNSTCTFLLCPFFFLHMIV